MYYGELKEGIFEKRPNRFIAFCQVDGISFKCHVKNTGRLGELLIPGARVLLQPASDPNRKTAYSLISVWKDGQWVNIDSQVPNIVAKEWIESAQWLKGIKEIKREKTFGNSRFDLYVETEEEKWFIEVKGVTLNMDGVARFPDAPTTRGLKHVEELSKCIKAGYRAAIIFVIQMKGIHTFAPFRERQPEFADGLLEAERNGVMMKAVDCIVDENSIVADQLVAVDLLR